MSAAHASPPAEGHVPPFPRERAVVRTAFDEALRVEAVRLGEFALVVVDRPDVALDPGAFGD